MEEKEDQKEGLALLEAATNALPSAMFMAPDTIRFCALTTICMPMRHKQS
jgi:hypothetical protein